MENQGLCGRPLFTFFPLRILEIFSSALNYKPAQANIA